MKPYCKGLPISYTPIQTSREFSVGKISCFKHSLKQIGLTGVISSRIRRVIIGRVRICVIIPAVRTSHKICHHKTLSLDSFFFSLCLFKVGFMSAECAERFSEKIRQRISAQFTPSGNSEKKKNL